ncbi:hypothetical protein CEXT_771901 [Caerostris extrusa]|uniref:Uncharacterized protein n=1 Tax=Caerostris extrusa TaxID=172846 RepID=A0AAV4UMR5_CAEEX|nr:hypothetical protein CEXT_771901 [Caerostris extrusa]
MNSDLVKEVITYALVNDVNQIICTNRRRTIKYDSEYTIRDGFAGDCLCSICSDIVVRTILSTELGQRMNLDAITLNQETNDKATVESIPAPHHQRSGGRCRISHTIS